MISCDLGSGAVATDALVVVNKEYLNDKNHSPEPYSTLDPDMFLLLGMK